MNSLDTLTFAATAFRSGHAIIIHIFVPAIMVSSHDEYWFLQISGRSLFALLMVISSRREA